MTRDRQSNVEVDEKSLHTGITVSACSEHPGVEFRLSDKKLILRELREGDTG